VRGRATVESKLPAAGSANAAAAISELTDQLCMGFRTVQERLKREDPQR
jgi:hypothetical protein